MRYVPEAKDILKAWIYLSERWIEQTLSFVILRRRKSFKEGQYFLILEKCRQRYLTVVGRNYRFYRSVVVKYLEKNSFSIYIL